VLKKSLDWLDNRSDYRRILLPLRRRVLPNGPSWAYTSASCLFWLFLIELITGLLLMTTYSPSTATAWASVHYIEQTTAGSFIRGLHFFIAQALIVLLVVHVMRVLLTAAFRAPRELIWITGLLLLPLMVVWAITGNPLSGSQKGVSQIEVEGNIIGSTPVVGKYIQKILIGGNEVGNLTLTHLYFLHVGLMPILVILLLMIHIAQIYRHGLSQATAKPSADRQRPYWPYQTVRNMLVLTCMLGLISFFAYQYGAPLEAPADPELANIPRPEWYFLSLFELRGYFSGEWEFIATMVIPGVVLLFFLLVPFIDHLLSERTSYVMRFIVVVVGGAVVATLTAQPALRDWKDDHFQQAAEQAHHLADRAREIADINGIPPEGAITLLRDDAKTQGPLLFKQHCISCHSHVDQQGRGLAAEKPSAPNLFGIGRQAWIAGMLDPERIAGEHYFGNTEFADGEMVSTLVDLFDQAELSEEEEKGAVNALRRQLSQVAAALSAEADVPNHDESYTAEDVAQGKELLTGDLTCTDCHRFYDEGELGSAVDLTGYASREWLMAIIADPEHERFYADDRNDRMPSFAKDANDPRSNLLAPSRLGLLVDWLRSDWPRKSDASENEAATKSQPELARRRP